MSASPDQARSRPSAYLPQRWFGGVVGALFVAVTGALLLLYRPGQGLRNSSYDWLFGTQYVLSGESAPVTNVVVVALTERCFSNMNAAPANLGWTNHARLIELLHAAQARMVVMDIAFIDPSRTNQFAVRPLADALQKASNVVLTAGFDVLRGQTNVSLPIDGLREAARGWGIGVVHRDIDFTARRHHPGIHQFPSLAWKAAELFGASVTQGPNATEQKTREEPRWLNYYTDQPFEDVPYSVVLLGLSQYDFKDKVVFVGEGSVAGYGGDSKEEYRSPTTWAKGRWISGVELHALTFSNFIRQDWLWRLPQWVELLLIVLIGGLVGYVEVAVISFEVGPTSAQSFSKLRRVLALIPRPFFALWFAFGVAIATWITTFCLFRSAGLWFPWLIVAIVQIPLAFGWALLFKTVKAHMETQFLARSLSVYVSPGRVKQIMNAPDLLKPGGVKRQVSVLFSDIAGFSRHCELKRWEPDEILHQLNGYYESAIGCIYQTEGTVMDLVGDAIFALWNAPQDQADHQARACRSAVLLHKNLVSFDEKQDLPWRTRIGLHTGEVCIGNIGSQTRFDYTAVGETINLASRLEGLNKQLGTSILATGLMQKAFGTGFVSRRVGNFRFKGLNQIVEVHEILDEGEQSEDAKVWLGTFEHGLRMFVRGKFNDAKLAFSETVTRRGEDGPSSFYLKILERGFQPPEGWFGEIDLSEK